MSRVSTAKVDAEQLETELNTDVGGDKCKEFSGTRVLRRVLNLQAGRVKLAYASSDVWVPTHCLGDL